MKLRNRVSAFGRNTTALIFTDFSMSITEHYGEDGTPEYCHVAVERTSYDSRLATVTAVLVVHGWDPLDLHVIDSILAEDVLLTCEMPLACFGWHTPCNNEVDYAVLDANGLHWSCAGHAVSNNPARIRSVHLDTWAAGLSLGRGMRGGSIW